MGESWGLWRAGRCPTPPGPSLGRLSPLCQGSDGLGWRALGRAGSPGGVGDGPGGPCGPDAVSCLAVLGCAKMCQAVLGLQQARSQPMGCPQPHADAALGN